MTKSDINVAAHKTTMTKLDQHKSWDVIIAGGGPAGFFAAIRCAELNPNLRVLILEKASQTLGKV